jgi:hypothetical protein
VTDAASPSRGDSRRQRDSSPDGTARRRQGGGRFGAAEPAVELFGDDLADMLGDQPDDQVDDALLVAAAAFLVLWLARHAVVDDPLDALADQVDDRVDHSLLVELVLVVVIVVMTVIVMMMTVPVVGVAAVVAVMMVAAVPSFVVAHESPASDDVH